MPNCEVQDTVLVLQVVQDTALVQVVQDTVLLVQDKAPVVLFSHIPGQVSLIK